MEESKRRKPENREPVAEADRFLAYGVLLRRKDGHQWLAWGDNGVAALFSKRSDAVMFKRDLDAAGCKNGQVIKIKVTHEYFS